MSFNMCFFGGATLPAADRLEYDPELFPLGKRAEWLGAGGRPLRSVFGFVVAAGCGVAIAFAPVQKKNLVKEGMAQNKDDSRRPATTYTTILFF
eukprot:scaffold37679_cov76-Cyclotella_meneghiniana.AAC.10